MGLPRQSYSVQCSDSAYYCTAASGGPGTQVIGSRASLAATGSQTSLFSGRSRSPRDLSHELSGIKKNIDYIFFKLQYLWKLISKVPTLGLQSNSYLPMKMIAGDERVKHSITLPLFFQPYFKDLHLLCFNYLPSK